jgi:hypothetical protein
MHIQQKAVDSVMLAPLAASATTARTANLDCIGADYATIRVVITSEANTNSTNVVLQLSESDDTTASNFATFNSSFNRTVDNTNAVIATNHVDLKGRKRYLRLTVTPDTTTNGAVNVSASASLQTERYTSVPANVVIG